MNKKPLTKNQIFKIFKKINPTKLNFEKINLLNSKNRFLAEKIKSQINLPPFNNSAVDGYAILDKDVGIIKRYKISFKISAGQNKKIYLKKGEVARIFTGAIMPINSTTVVMQENVEKKNNFINILKYPLLGENCRLKGEDISKNITIFKKGQKLDSKNISLLAAIGKDFVKVKKKLKVGYFTSGNELFNLSKKISRSKIYNSNQYILASLLNKNYLNAHNLGVLKDLKTEISKKILKETKKYSVILTTGGASVGDEDYLVETIKEHGELIFWKTAIKPGRPLAFGKINKTFIICLPGNPVSVYLLYGMIVKSFLKYLCSSLMIFPKCYPAITNFSMRKKTERLEWLRVNIEKNNKDKIYVNKYPKQGSGMISSVAYTDGIIEIPEGVSQIKKGDVYKLYLFRDLFN